MTALSDTLIYSSPMLGEMDFLEIAQIVAHEKWLWKKEGFLCMCTHGCSIFSLSCIPNSQWCEARTIEQAHRFHFFFYFQIFLPQHHNNSVFYTSNMLINTAYYYALPTANLSSDTLLMTWNLYRKHQTSFPVCTEGTAYLSRAHSDEHSGTSVCVRR